jgi:hypothetical protein
MQPQSNSDRAGWWWLVSVPRWPRRFLTSLLVMAALTAWPALASRAQAADPGSGLELGGQFGFGPAFAVGTSHRKVTPTRTSGADGGGLGVDVAGRAWLGRLVAGGNLMMVGLIGANDLVVTGGAGVRLQTANWRVMPMLEAGAHTVSGMGSGGLFTDTVGSPATVPCGVDRLALVKRPVRPKPISLGLSFFLLVDGGTKEVDVQSHTFAFTSDSRYRAGGVLGGMTLHVTAGS